MYQGKKISVVVPCHNEEQQIEKLIATMPTLVDKIIIVDDASTDKTFEIASNCALKNKKIVVLQHRKNQGVGAAIATGYRHALENNSDITAVMAGDGQMDPADLETVLQPVADGLTDYCKGNRFFFSKGLKKIPRRRLLGNFMLTALTKIVSGYWHISDTQCGYTAISQEALASIDIDNIYPGYGCPNDILTKLNISEMRVAEVPVNPLYNVGESSKMKIPRVILPISFLLFKLFFQRMFHKYIFRTGHPLVLAYLLSGLLFLCCCIIGIYILFIFLTTGMIPKVALIVAGVSLIISLQLLLNAFTMDFDYNRDLSVELKNIRAPQRAKELLKR